MNKKSLIIFSSVLLLSPLVNSMPVKADTLSDLEQKKQEVQQKSNEVNSQIEEKQSSLDALNQEKAELEAKVADLQKQLNELLDKLDQQEQKLVEIQNKIDELTAQIEELKQIIEQRTEKLNNQARFIQTNAGLTDIVSMLMTADDFSDLVGKVSVVTKIVTANKDIVEQQEADQAKMEAAKAEVETEQVAAEELKAQIEVSKNNVVAQKTEIDSQIQVVMENYELTESQKADLESTKSSLAAQTAEITNSIQTEEARIAAEKAEAERQAALAAAEEAAKEQANVVASASNSSSSTQSSSSSSANDSGFIRPASGYNSSPFGYRINPVDGVYRLHPGTDIAGSGPIVAAQSGTVTYAGYDATYGYHVIIDHGTINGKQISTLYGHMVAGLLVAPGQKVSQGQQIGVMGTTGQSTGVHLHFEVHEDGVPVNPLGTYISY